MKTALVITVKNEARLLRNNLLYHHAIGVEKAFVYFDDTTDNGRDLIADLDFVEMTDSVPEKKYAHLDFLEKFTSNAAEHHTARQCLNTYDALLQCRKEGIAWLISIDADELVLPAIEGNINTLLKTVPEDHDLLHFETLEAIQRKERYNNVFAEEDLFKKQAKKKYPKIVKRFLARYKNVYNPFSSQYIPFSFWYGHVLGKYAIRISADVVPHNVHRYKYRENKQIKEWLGGRLLHFHAYDAEDFIKKFRNFTSHPDTFLSGNRVESLKLLLRDVVNKAGYSEKELESYYTRNLMFSEKEVQKLLKNRVFGIFKRPEKTLVKIETVKEIFSNMKGGNR